ncbi:hypothetical protein Acr_00g0049170 [Actinidia rufa]|uniref:Uncharacterized protein n=1 Tax=Actinidia rufa TaxID=165716 RepID=A0A7J0DKD1_9ERIC|nr:hypothetical protein Acr_00g0049170 [Actinidia rufa]
MSVPRQHPCHINATLAHLPHQRLLGWPNRKYPSLSPSSLTTPTIISGPQPCSISFELGNFGNTSPAMPNHPIFSRPMMMMMLYISNIILNLKTGTVSTPRLSPDFQILQSHPSIRSLLHSRLPRKRDTHSYEDYRSLSKSKRKGYHNRQTAVVTDSSGTSPNSSSSTLIAADVETIVTQVLSRTNLHSSALSTTLGSPPSPNLPSRIMDVPNASPPAAPSSVPYKLKQSKNPPPLSLYKLDLPPRPTSSPPPASSPPPPVTPAVDSLPPETPAPSISSRI